MVILMIRRPAVLPRAGLLGVGTPVGPVTQIIVMGPTRQTAGKFSAETLKLSISTKIKTRNR
jgi:hypothetical protein